MWIFIFTAKKKKKAKVKQVKDKLKQSHCLPPTRPFCPTPHHSCRAHRKRNAKEENRMSSRQRWRAPGTTRWKSPEEVERKSGRLEWKRLSELSESPGTTPGGMLINYLTILQPQKFFLWRCPFVSQRKGLWAWRRRKKGAAVWAMAIALAGGEGSHFSAAQN